MFNLVEDTPGHKSDVKAISCYSSDKKCLVATASRDQQVKVWELQSQPPALVETLLHSEHSSFVNAVDIGRISLGQEDEALCVLSGGTDGIVYVWDVDRNRPLGTLLGHTSNVCFLKLLDNVVYSCSWDKTIRLWQGLHCLQVLTGHSEAVWSCCPISDGCLLSGMLVNVASAFHVLSASADKTIRLWRDGACIRTYTGHTDAVRSVISLDDSFEELGDFASCGNDGSIKFWRLDGECMYSLKAHDSFIYTIKAYRDHLFSAGEDRTLKIWRRTDGRRIECVQAISLPVVSIWTLDCTAAGNVLCGCSDGRVYVFSPHEALDPGARVVKEFQSRLGSFQVSKALTGDREVSQREDLLNPGRKVGETKLIGGSDGTKVYQWNGTSWEKIGNVVEGPAKNDKVSYNGKEYDYVFDVELDKGDAGLKLPFNNGENPYAVASRFIGDNNLRPDLVDQIVDFIVKNTTARTIDSGGELFNPYLVSERVNETQSDPRYLDANTAGIARKLEEFAAIESYTGITQPMEHLIGALYAGTRLPSHSEAVVGALTQAMDRWKPEHLFPVFDATRVLHLRSASFTLEQLASITASSHRITSSSSALLTLGRLVYNLLCDNECYWGLIGMIDNMCCLVESCYSVGVKDKLLPAKLLAGFTIHLSAQSEEVSRNVSQAILPLTLTILRASVVPEELRHLTHSLKTIFPLLGTRDRKAVLMELELKRTSVDADMDTEIGEIVQNMQKIAK